MMRHNSSVMKHIVISFYGGTCFRCGESDIDVLTIDHLNQNGASHRKELAGNGTDWRSKTGVHTYRWLIVQGLPDGFRVACFNCNFKLWREHKRSLGFDYVS